jgi:hypothetical protein
MDDFSCKLSGDRAVLRMFEELPAAAQDRVIKPLLNLGARKLAQAEKSEAPDDSGLMKLAIGASSLKVYGSGGGKLLFITTGVRRGYRRAVTPGRGGRPRRQSKGFTEIAEQALMRNPVKYLHLVTGGRRAIHASGKILYSPQSGKFFGKSAAATEANPFIQRAGQQSASSVVSEIGNAAEQGIVAEAEKLAGGRQ